MYCRYGCRQMRRPRKATGDGHISGYALPSFKSSDWKDLEQIVDVIVSVKARETIEHAANEYTEQTLLQQSGGIRAKMLGQVMHKQHQKAVPLKTFHAALHNLVASWTQADQHTESAQILIDFSSEIKFLGNIDLEQIRGDLGTTAIALDHYLLRMEKNVSATSDLFCVFVQELAKTLKKEGLRITAATLTDTSKRTSSFVAFVIRLNDILPDNVKRSHRGNAAWSKAVARALLPN